jgi:SRSO17 transposase
MVRSPRVSRGSTAGRQAAARTAKSASFCVSASPLGAAFLDRELYLPEEWMIDPVRCREAGIPEAVAFATKGELAKAMLARAFAAGVKVQWVVGDTVYGYDDLRSWLEHQHQPSVLAVPETHPVWMHGHAQPVGLVAALLPQEAWVPLSAGEGSPGPRLYDWAWLEVEAAPEARGSWGSWILIRRSLCQPSKRARLARLGPERATAGGGGAGGGQALDD